MEYITKTCADAFYEKYESCLKQQHYINLKSFEECRGQDLLSIDDGRSEEEKKRSIIIGETAEDFICTTEFGFKHIILNRNKADKNYPFQYSWDVYDIDTGMRIEVKAYSSPTIQFTIRGQTIFSPPEGFIHKGPVVDLTQSIKHSKADIILFINCSKFDKDKSAVCMKPTLIIDNNFELLKQIAQPQKNIKKVSFSKTGQPMISPYWIGTATYQVINLDKPGTGLRLIN